MARKRTTIPTKPHDARVQRSIEALVAAFLTLLESKPLDQILIKDITETAGLSYPTFFRRFASKEELLEHIAADEIKRLLELGQTVKLRDFENAARNMCQYVQARRTLWDTLLNGGAAGAMREEFMRVSKLIGDSRPKINPWLPMDLSVSFVTSGFFEILAWWMRQPPDYPVDNVIIFFNELIFRDSLRQRDVQLHDW